MIEAPTRPALRYHGGKWRLATWIIQHLPRHRVYVEPYGGGASVLLRKPRSFAEVYNDLDGEVVSFFKITREQPGRLAELVKQTPFAREEYKASFERTDDPLESARRLLLRSFAGFGSDSVTRKSKSGFRSNTTLRNTTPAHDWARLPKNIGRIAKRMRGVVIECRPALELIRQHDRKDTLFYLDPPYVHSTRLARHGYVHELSDDEHVQLSHLAHSIAGLAVLSGYHSELYDGLYRDWHAFERKTIGDGGCPRTEVLWLNDLAIANLPQPQLFGRETK